jgi:hypothetical protein
MPAPVVVAGAAAPASGAGVPAGSSAAAGSGQSAAGQQLRLPRSLPRSRRRRRDRRSPLQRLALASLGILGFLLGLLLLVLLPIAMVAALVSSSSAAAPGEAPSVYWPMYTAAADYYKVNPYLLASIHKAESDFGRGTELGVSAGANACGAAGPMQFGVVGVPPYNAVPRVNCSAGSTWQDHWRAAGPIEDQRPQSYPLQRSSLRACDGVPNDVGCVYDSFDAIAGAAQKLHEDGADESLYSAGTDAALFAYNGSSTYVQEVLTQAQRWELEGAAGANGPLRQRIVAIAVAELKKGIHEDAGSCNPYGPCADWCAMFSTWVWEQAGVQIRSAMSGEGLNPYWVADLETYAKGHGLWHSSPTPGDMVVWAGHVALVERVMGGGEISEIGGNQSDAVTRLVGIPSGLGMGPVDGYFSPPER